MQQQSYSENEKALCYHGPLIYEAVSCVKRKRERRVYAKTEQHVKQLVMANFNVDDEIIIREGYAY